MNRDREKELLKRFADEKRENEREIEENPLLQYSTSQLKAELRRRKGGKELVIIHK